MKSVELLAPARNLECGIAAIDHGADAVYIGADHFGARAAVGNSIDDIASLCNYAHRFGAKVFVTVNTIVYDPELEAVRLLLRQLDRVGVDAVLVQDMALVPMMHDLWNEGGTMKMHASTQTDNRSVEKVRWLSSLGFSRVVLARELSVSEIADIHRACPDVELEVFVHGALCVSYSGQCYASQFCFSRSANRGECAQFCRMKFDLIDADGNIIERERYLLSLKDMCQINNIEALAKAGAVSFKIEGRLKDSAYVKNVTAAYSQRLDDLVGRCPTEYVRSSLGKCEYSFQPNLMKTFNRGFTTYFASGRVPDISSPDTPKALGEYVGKVKEIRSPWFSVAGLANFANGDGLCFVNARRELEGFRVNKVERNKLFPHRMPSGLRPGLALYRNNDQDFERVLSRRSSSRRIPVALAFDTIDSCLRLAARVCATNISAVIISDPQSLEKSEKPQHDNIIRQLSKMGATQFVVQTLDIADDFDFFIPSSILSDLRRRIVDALDEAVVKSVAKERLSVKEHGAIAPLNDVTNTVLHAPYDVVSSFYPQRFSYLYNIANAASRSFYKEHGLNHVAPAFEKVRPAEGVLMQCRYCLRYSLGCCVKRGGRVPSWKEPLVLRLYDGREFPLQFDCKHCQMNVLSAPREKGR